MDPQPPESAARAHRWCRAAMLLAMAFTALVWAGFIPVLSASAWQLDTNLRDKLSLMLTPASARDDLVFVGLDDDSRIQPGVTPAVRSQSRALTLLRHSSGNESLDRRVYIDLVNRLADAGARQIIFDVLFLGSSGDPAIDREFARVLKKHGARIILAELLNPQDDGSYQPLRSIDQLPFLAEMPGQVPGSAYVNLWPDAGDNVIRHMIYETTLSDLTGAAPVPGEPVHRSLSALAARQIRVAIPDRPNPRLRFAVPARENPDAEPAPQVSGAYPPHGIYRLFVPEIWRTAYDDGRFFRDKAVLISTATRGDEDRHAIPGATIFGAQIHLHALGSLLDSAFWTEAPRWLELLALVMMAGVGAMLVLAFHHPFTQALSCVALAGGFLVACVVLSEFSGFLFAGTPGILGLLAVSFVGLTVKLFAGHAVRA